MTTVVTVVVSVLVLLGTYLTGFTKGAVYMSERLGKAVTESDLTGEAKLKVLEILVNALKRE